MVDFILILYLQIYGNCEPTSITHLLELLQIIWVRCIVKIYMLIIQKMMKCINVMTCATCVTTRCVVLDVFTRTHGDTLLLNLTPYISCRVCLKQILTNNGPVFASNTKQLFATQKNIKWIFNPEEAPWFEGFCKRLVGSVKRCIKKTTSRTYLTFTELQTLFF